MTHPIRNLEAAGVLKFISLPSANRQENLLSLKARVTLDVSLTSELILRMSSN